MMRGWPVFACKCRFAEISGLVTDPAGDVIPRVSVIATNTATDSLEDLEAAAHDGRLSDLAGIGKKKLAGITDTLTTRLGRVRLAGRVHDIDEPSTAELLDVDREYREKAIAGELPVITPRRFNPERKAWLPILHMHRGERNYTALYIQRAVAGDNFGH